MAKNNETPTAAELEQAGTEATSLMIRLMQQNAKDAAYTANAVAEGYKRDLDKARAELACVRQVIEELCAKPWVPNPEQIRAALYPREELIRMYLGSEEGNGPC